MFEGSTVPAATRAHCFLRSMLPIKLNRYGRGPLANGKKTHSAKAFDLSVTRVLVAAISCIALVVLVATVNSNMDSSSSGIGPLSRFFTYCMPDFTKSREKVRSIVGATVTNPPMPKDINSSPADLNKDLKVNTQSCSREEGFDLSVANHVAFPYETYVIPFADEEACCKLCAREATCAVGVYDAETKVKCWLVKNYMSTTSDKRRTLLYPPGRHGKKFWD